MKFTNDIFKSPNNLMNSYTPSHHVNKKEEGKHART